MARKVHHAQRRQSIVRQIVPYRDRAFAPANLTVAVAGEASFAQVMFEAKDDFVALVDHGLAPVRCRPCSRHLHVGAPWSRVKVTRSDRRDVRHVAEKYLVRAHVQAVLVGDPTKLDDVEAAIRT